MSTVLTAEDMLELRDIASRIRVSPHEADRMHGLIPLLLDALENQFAFGVEVAAGLVEAHGRVSRCCDAQPGGQAAFQLAACLRKHTRRPARG